MINIHIASGLEYLFIIMEMLNKIYDLPCKGIETYQATQKSILDNMKTQFPLEQKEQFATYAIKSLNMCSNCWFIP